MVPQYVTCYRDRGVPRERVFNWYVLTLGGYRCFHAMGWIFRCLQGSTLPRPFVSWEFDAPYQFIGGAIAIFFFVDFLGYRFFGRSALRSAVVAGDSETD